MVQYEELWSSIKTYGYYIKMGLVGITTILIGRIFHNIVMFLIRKYFTDRDKDIRELYDSRNDHETRISVIESKIGIPKKRKRKRK